MQKHQSVRPLFQAWHAGASTAAVLSDVEATERRRAKVTIVRAKITSAAAAPDRFALAKVTKVTPAGDCAGYAQLVHVVTFRTRPDVRARGTLNFRNFRECVAGAPNALIPGLTRPLPYFLPSSDRRVPAQGRDDG